jgi:ABC-type multidrug transport system ATPase subunit
MDRVRPKDSEPALRTRRLTKRFGLKSAVDDVTLTVGAGTVYGLIGPNGAGKTTTFSILAGYLRPTEGSAEVLGFAPTAVNELRSRLGVLPQDALLPSSDTVGEFLLHMGRLQDLPKDKAMESARRGLEEVSGSDWWKQRCGSLSHGMAKRVALAQAFLGDPEVVLLDEPTAGLDPRIAWEVRQVIKAKRGQRTIVISSHNLQELEEICDAAAILDRGRLVAHGTMAELTRSRPGPSAGPIPARFPSRDCGTFPWWRASSSTTSGASSSSASSERARTPRRSSARSSRCFSRTRCGSAAWPRDGDWSSG